MKSFLYSLAFIFLLMPASAKAQSKADSAHAFSMIAGTFGLQLPSADLGRQFGSSFSIGPTFLYKTKQNYLFGFDYNYIYSEKVKNTDSILAGISTIDGNIIDGNGMFAEFFFYESAFLITGKFGKIMPLSFSNQNSGLMILGSAGVFQHKIWIYSREDTAPQITGDYKKGYDRLRNGFAINQFIGYFHASENGKINYYLGFDATQALTKSRRSYDFTTMSADLSTHLDMLWGLKFAWVFPIYRTVPKEYYYY